MSALLTPAMALVEFAHVFVTDLQVALVGKLRMSTVGDGIGPDFTSQRSFGIARVGSLVLSA